MRKYCVIVVLSIFIFFTLVSIGFSYEKEINNLSNSIVEKITKSGKKTIAVVDFSDLQNDVTELGRFIAEELSVDLLNSAKGFEVVDRSHLKSILKEHKLSVTGLIDPENVKKLGHFAGVDAIITGSVTPFGDSIRITCKVIATDTAKVIAASKSDIAKTKAIEELLDRGIEAEKKNYTTQKTGSGESNKNKNAKSIQSTIVKNILFETSNCTYYGDEIQCPILITSKDKNIRLYFNDLRIIDDNGNEYKIRKHYDGNFMVGIPTKAVFSFEGISLAPNIVNLAIVNGHVQSLSHNNPGEVFQQFQLTTQIRNIPVLPGAPEVQPTNIKKKRR